MKIEFQSTGLDLEDPLKLDSNIYDPDASSLGSLDVLNGHLDYQNVDYGSTPDPLPLTAIRRGALSRSKMVGATINADYQKRFFFYWLLEGTVNGADSGLIEPLPGAGIEFHSPSSGLLILTWQVSYSSDLEEPDSSLIHELTSLGKNGSMKDERAFVTLMGAKGRGTTLSELGWRQYFPNAVFPDTDELTGSFRTLGQGRTWSGHHIMNAEADTWYRYGIGLFSTCNMARIRVRNFKYLFFPNAPTANHIGAATQSSLGGL